MLQLNIPIKMKLKSGKEVKLNRISNKLVYQELINEQYEEPANLRFWTREYNTSRQTLTHTFHFIFRELEDNKMKMFRWKLLYKILPNRELLYKWKLADSPRCMVCNEIENYEHYFKCRYFENFIQFTKDVFQTLGITKNIFQLNNIAIGYKIHDRHYNTINYLISCMAYTMYKSYHISEQKVKSVNCKWIFRDILFIKVQLHRKRKIPLPWELKKVCKLIDNMYNW